MSTAPKPFDYFTRPRDGARSGSRFWKKDPKTAGPVNIKIDNWTLHERVSVPKIPTLIRLIQVFFVLLWYWLVSVFTTTPIRNRLARDTRRARLLRSAIEFLGGAYIKLGQQLSLRQDLLPVVYCEELRGLQDQVKGFPFEEARQEIEKEIGRPIESVFINLNTEAIGKASIGSVYEAWLRDEHESEPVRVAIKVRRPRIVEVVTRDLKTIDWICITLEYTSFLRPGFTTTFRAQLWEILLDEMDLRKEARFQEIFRAKYKKHKSFRISAPKIFHRYCGKAVMVSEYIDAIPINCVISAIERKDREYLAYLESLKIRPKRMARRLIEYSFAGFFDDPFFHGDPHPGNIYVLPGDRLVFIDFGACGSFPKRDRDLMLQFHHFRKKMDIRGMVECVIALMEPLEPFDVAGFRASLEKEYWEGYYALLSKHSDWRDRTSYRLWVALYDLVRAHQISIPLNMIRMIRATLLYDTIAAQLNPKINVFKVFEIYEKKVALRVQRRFYREAARQALIGPDVSVYSNFKRMVGLTENAMFRLEKFLGNPPFNFAAIPDKIFYFISSTATWISSLLMLSGFFFALYIYSTGYRRGQLLPTYLYFVLPSHWLTLTNQAARTMEAFFFTIAIATFFYVRKIRWRFNDPDDPGKGR